MFVGSNTMVMPWPRFHARANNFNITYLIFWQEQNLSNQTRKKKRCYGHYLQSGLNRICDWEILIIDTAEMDRFLRQKELYWYNKLKTFTGFGLDKNHVYMMQHIRKKVVFLLFRYNKYYYFCFFGKYFIWCYCDFYC